MAINLLATLEIHDIHTNFHYYSHFSLGFVIVTDWSNEKAMADCMIFFIDSFHAIASSACFLLHELAINPDIQSKLYNEIESIQKHSSNESLSYEALAAMKYLDMVVSEAFRRWCPIPQLQLTCAKPLCWAQSDGSSVQLTTGDNVLIPTYAIHMDADNFAKPEKFDPERFNETTKNSSKPNTFLPFGVSDTSKSHSRRSFLIELDKL